MSNLIEAAKMAEIRVALLNLLLHLSEDETFTLEEAAEDVKALLREVEAVHYPFE
ncbi:hypothetical protein J7E63_13100 [Bacillus sp. ISL-75]|uniref:hypothetical protein n=1 Tax=Bacillus sp. ISL-75 TaxID=2819137 RepID=UPI001BEB9ED9|nr:hypothetical protein [Bacillus sp. ISL-75]MBT2727877.1 hypothetical protein [Bacillus sp. ISL-75]